MAEMENFRRERFEARLASYRLRAQQQEEVARQARQEVEALRQKHEELLRKVASSKVRRVDSSELLGLERSLCWWCGCFCRSSVEHHVRTCQFASSQIKNNTNTVVKQSTKKSA